MSHHYSGPDWGLPHGDARPIMIYKFGTPPCVERHRVFAAKVWTMWSIHDQEMTLKSLLAAFLLLASSLLYHRNLSNWMWHHMFEVTRGTGTSDYRICYLFSRKSHDITLQ